jgi:hypothetical protein
MKTFESTSISTRLGEELALVRKRHGRSQQAEVRVHGNVVTCLVSDRPARRSPGSGPGAGETNPEGYVHDAVAAVVKVTRQRVSRFSALRRGPHEIVEIFALEATRGRGQPPA